MVMKQYLVSSPMSSITENKLKETLGRRSSMKMGVIVQVNTISNGIEKSFTEEKKGEMYNPYAHRKVLHPTTYMDTLLHMFKGSVGTGFLAMPNAFACSGYVIGIVGTVIISIISTYCVHILVDAELELCRRKKVPSMTYPATSQAALEEGPQAIKWLAPCAKKACDFLLIFGQLGGGCVYIVFVASNLKALGDVYIEPLDIRTYILLMLVPLVLVNCVRNLKFLAPFSTLANITIFISCVIIFYYVFQDLPSISERRAFGTFDGMAQFMGIVFFTTGNMGLMLPLENEMKRPQSFNRCCGVLNVGTIGITLFYMIFAFFGYLKYGDEAGGSLTLNLPQGDFLSQSVQLLLAIQTFFTTPLCYYVGIDIIWNDYLEPQLVRHKLFWDYFLRTVVVLSTAALSVAIPNLSLIISIMGVVGSCAIGMTFPPIIHLVTFWDSYRGVGFIWLLFSNLALILLSFALFIVSIGTSVAGLMETFG